MLPLSFQTGFGESLNNFQSLTIIFGKLYAVFLTYWINIGSIQKHVSDRPLVFIRSKKGSTRHIYRIERGMVYILEYNNNK